MELVNQLLQNKLVRSALIALCGAILTVLTDAVTAWVSGSGLTANQAAAVMGAWSWVVNAVQIWLRQAAADSEADKDAMDLQRAIADRPLTAEQVQQMRSIVDRSIAEIREQETSISSPSSQR